MKAFYDKILFIVALLIVAASAAFYVIKSGSLPDNAEEGPTIITSGDLIDPIKIAKTDDIPAAIPTPEAQDERGLWIFDIFTPPEIFWDTTEKKWVVIPPAPDLENIWEYFFGLELLDISQGLFPVQLAGYSGGTTADQNVLYELQVKGDDGRVRIQRAMMGDTLEGVGVTLRDFKVDTEITEDERGTVIRRIAKLTVYDQNSDQEVVLQDNRLTIIEGSATIVLRTVRPPFPTTMANQRFEYTKAGQSKTFTIKNRSGDFDVTYTLDEYTLKPDKTVKITKSSSLLEQDDVRVIEPIQVAQVVEEKPEPEETPEPEATETDDVFEGIF